MVFTFLVFGIVFGRVLVEARVARKREPCIAPLNGEVEMKTVEDSNAKANTTSISRISNLLPPTITL